MRRPHRPDLPIVALEGPSGVGKSTLLRSLVRATGRVGLVEAVDRAREPPRLDFRSPGELRRIELRLVESELQRVREAAELTRRGELLLLDTGFVGPLTYSLGLAALLGPRWDVTPDVARGYTEALAMGAWAIPDLTVYLDADPEVVARRVRADPRSHPVERALRHAAVAAYERGIWLGTIRDVIPGRVVAVRADGAVPSVVGRVVGAIARAPTVARSRAADARRLLEALRTAGGRSVPPVESETVMKTGLTRGPLRR